jgi:hypothetical protein
MQSPCPWSTIESHGKVKSTTGFQGLIPPNTPPTIRGHRGSSKKNTEEMELLPYVVKRIIVLESRTNSAARGSIRRPTISIKARTRIWTSLEYG